ncbi:MAG TPA: hypothetical protein VNL18_04650 [Gemmatimonadales bacterium]|nr:hypothetical protein [Gemmatimonadales bacterium]
MRNVLLFCTAAAALGCYKAEDRSASEAAATPTISLADLAGKWTMQTMAQGSDSVLVTSELNATATTEGWTQILPGRDPIALHVVVAGDSVVTHAGPYESVLRPGTTVTTENVMRLVNGMLEGRTTARYSGPNVGADSVLQLRTRGTRAP